MPKEETLVVNKDLSNILKFQGGGQQNICFYHNRFGVRKRIDENQRKKCLNLKFTRGFSGAIKDGVQKNQMTIPQNVNKTTNQKKSTSKEYENKNNSSSKVQGIQKPKTNLKFQDFKKRSMNIENLYSLHKSRMSKFGT